LYFDKLAMLIRKLIGEKLTITKTITIIMRILDNLKETEISMTMMMMTISLGNGRQIVVTV